MDTKLSAFALAARVGRVGNPTGLASLRSGSRKEEKKIAVYDVK